MLDWSFNDFECSPLLVSLLLNEEMSKDESSLDDLYNADKKQLLSDLCKSKQNSDFLSSILDGIKKGDLITDKKYPSEKLDTSNLHNIFIEPVSFFRWAEKQGYSHTYNVKCNVDQRETELRIKNYRDYAISKETVTELMREPLWLVCDAILYLHGFVPMEDEGSSYLGRNPNLSIINSDGGMKKIHEYLYDANKLKEINLFERSGSKVKPSDFMAWADKLELSFPNLITSNTKKKECKVIDLSTKERNALYKIILGMAMKGYGYDPEASKSDVPKEIEGDLAQLNINLTAETIRGYLKKAHSEFPVSIEKP